MGQPGFGPGGNQPDQPQDQPQQPAWGEPAQQPGQPAQPQPTWDQTQQQPQQPATADQGAAPTSGPGFAAPGSGGPAYGAPSSGPPGFDASQQPGAGHTMAMPTLGDPHQPSAPPYAAPPPSGKSPWTMVLAGTTALFFLISAVLGGFLISTNNDLDKANKTIEARDNTISDKNKKIKDLEDDLDKAEDELDSKKEENSDLEDQKETIAKCLKLLFEALDASAKKDRKTLKRKLDELKQPCNDASRLIN